MASRGSLAGGVFLFILLAFLQILPASAGSLKELVPAGLADGAGIWVNMWHYPEGDLDSYCSRLRAHGVRNVFVQTSRSNTEAICNKTRLGEFLEAAHRHDLRLIAWSFAELADPDADAAKLVAAARFQSPAGERMDGIAGNLEKNLAAWRVQSYSETLRRELGENYPMVAVVFSPLNRAPQVASTPWKLLARYWDVIAPMTYWGGKYQKLDAYTYTVTTARKVRELTGSAAVELHLIGDGMGTTASDIKQFFQACRDLEVTSASLYPNHRPSAEQFVVLASYGDYFPTNARFRLAAFRELTRSGSLPAPPGNDPAKPIARGEFYKLVVRHLWQGKRPWKKDVDELNALANSPPEMSALDALEELISAGFLEGSPDDPYREQALKEPIETREALSLIAGLVDRRSGRGGRNHARPGRRADSWLVQPAVAEPKRARLEQEPRRLNYLDAAQMVLLAKPGLR